MLRAILAPLWALPKSMVPDWSPSVYRCTSREALRPNDAPLGKSPGASACPGLLPAKRPSLRDERSVGAPADGPVKSPSRQLDKNVMLRPVMPAEWIAFRLKGPPHPPIPVCASTLGGQSTANVIPGCIADRSVIPDHNRGTLVWKGGVTNATTSCKPVWFCASAKEGDAGHAPRQLKHHCASPAVGAGRRRGRSGGHRPGGTGVRPVQGCSQRESSARQACLSVSRYLLLDSARSDS